MNRKQERIHLLERQVERLQKRITALELRSNKYSWTRVAIFFVGLGLALLAFFLLNCWWGVGLAAVTFVLFAVAAHFHSRIERSLARHKLLSYSKATQLARIHLNWEAIPPAYPVEPVGEHPFEIDLDITGFRSLHQLLNTAVSREGSQRLHDWLLATTPDLQLIHRRQTLVSELTPLTLFRDKLLLNSLLASRRSSEQLEGKRLLNWLGQQSLSTSLLPLLLGSSALCLLTIVLLLLTVFAGLPSLWMLSILCTLALFFSTAHQRGDLFDDLFYLRDAFGTLSSVFDTGALSLWAASAPQEVV